MAATTIERARAGAVEAEQNFIAATDAMTALTESGEATPEDIDASIEAAAAAEEAMNRALATVALLERRTELGRLSEFDPDADPDGDPEKPGTVAHALGEFFAQAAAGTLVPGSRTELGSINAVRAHALRVNAADDFDVPGVTIPAPFGEGPWGVHFATPNLNHLRDLIGTTPYEFDVYNYSSERPSVLSEYGAANTVSDGTTKPNVTFAWRSRQATRRTHAGIVKIPNSAARSQAVFNRLITVSLAAKVLAAEDRFILSGAYDDDGTPATDSDQGLIPILTDDGAVLDTFAEGYNLYDKLWAGAMATFVQSEGAVTQSTALVSPKTFERLMTLKDENGQYAAPASIREFIARQTNGQVAGFSIRPTFGLTDDEAIIGAFGLGNAVFEQSPYTLVFDPYSGLDTNDVRARGELMSMHIVPFSSYFTLLDISE